LVLGHDHYQRGKEQEGELLGDNGEAEQKTCPDPSFAPNTGQTSQSKSHCEQVLRVKIFGEAH
jgi:hypothetical protein